MIAFRVGIAQLDVGGARLCSPVQAYVYQSAIARNETGPIEHLNRLAAYRPSEPAAYGFFSLKAEHLRAQIGTWQAFPTLVLMRVELCGRVIVHQKGYRSQGLIIRALAFNSRLRSESMRAIEKRLSVPITVYVTQDDYSIIHLDNPKLFWGFE